MNNAIEQKTATPTATPYNSMNDGLLSLEKLKLPQNFSETLGVKKALVTVPVRKPSRQEYVRVHPGADYRIDTFVLELKEERETYLVERELWSELSNELVPKSLLTCINRQGVLTLWPIRLPSEDGRIDEWNRSALEAAAMAQTRWVRVTANMNLGAYEVYEASGNLPEPEWPNVSFQEIIRIAFLTHQITTLDHPVINRLRGQV